MNRKLCRNEKNRPKTKFNANRVASLNTSTQSFLTEKRDSFCGGVTANTNFPIFTFGSVFFLNFFSFFRSSAWLRLFWLLLVYEIECAGTSSTDEFRPSGQDLFIWCLGRLCVALRTFYLAKTKHNTRPIAVTTVTHTITQTTKRWNRK